MIGRSANYVPPIRLADPLQISFVEAISDFFWQYPIEDAKSRTWRWYIDAVQNPDVNAGDLVLFFESLNQLLENAYAFCKDKAGSDHQL